MKTKLLKRLRRESKKQFFVTIEKDDKLFPYRVRNINDEYDHYVSRHHAINFAIEQCDIRRRQWILNEARLLRYIHYNRVY